MQLDFEFVQEITKGNYSDLIHLWDNEANLLYIQDGRMRSTYATTPNGEWEDKEFIDDVDVSIDDNISCFRIDTMGGFGAIGSYKAGNVHKLVIYEYQFDISEYLNAGSIKHSIDNSITSFTLTLENPENPNPDYEGNVVADEDSALISPGAKVVFKFGAGNEIADYEMGTLYIDQSNFTVLSETASVEGRNLIGKALRDQTLDELYQTDLENINTIIERFLQHGKLNPNQYRIENTDKEGWFDFKPNMNILQAIEEMFKATIDWKITELADGRIIVGSPSFIDSAVSNSVYSFHRNKDIFSRGIVRDDMSSYRRVCIHDSDFALMVFRDVESYSGWNLQANKTLYVQVPDGTNIIEAETYAEELTNRLEKVGKVESFTGPFRPHLLCGDEAVITDETGNKSLGLITEITYNFGKQGFYTNFSVDRGGRLGKGRITDFIKQITEGVVPPERAIKTGYEEPEREDKGTIIVMCYDEDTGVLLKRKFDTGFNYGRWYVYPAGHAPAGYFPVSEDTIRVILSEEEPKRIINIYYTKDE